MSDFFQVLSDFLGSDLAKSWGWLILACFIIAVCVVGWLISFCFIKFYIPAKLFEANKIKDHYQELEKEKKDLLEKNEDLLRENKKLKEHIIQYEALESVNVKDDFEDKALKKFSK